MERITSLDTSKTEHKIIRIILVDVYPLMRQAQKTGIEKQQDLEVIAEACDGEEALLLSSKLHPDILLLGLDTSNPQELQVLKQIKNRCPEIKILVSLPTAYQNNTLEIQRAGADGYLSKKEPIEGFIHAIRSVISTEITFYQPLIRYSPQESPSGNIAITKNASDVLSERELVILKYVAKGMTNKDIASTMKLSLPTVKVTLSNIFLKMQVSSRVEAVSYGLKYGILTLNDINNTN